MPDEFPAGHRQVARGFRTDRQDDGVIILQQLLDRNILADMAVGMELDAFGAHLADAAIDDRLLQLEIGDAVTQQTADARRLLEYRDIMADARQLLRAGQARRARSDDGELLAGARRGDQRLDPAFVPAALARSNARSS